MNTLYIHENKVDLLGFPDIGNQASFIFRTGGLAISSKKENINAEQKLYNIYNSSIENEELAKQLIQLGFLKMHSFAKGSDGIYYSPYPNQ